MPTVRQGRVQPQFQLGRLPASLLSLTAKSLTLPAIVRTRGGKQGLKNIPSRAGFKAGRAAQSRGPARGRLQAANSCMELTNGKADQNVRFSGEPIYGEVVV
jgi:hypothetical protein